MLAGIIMYSVGSLSFTSRERVADVGPIEVTAERERAIPLPPIVAGLAIVGGLVLIATSSRRAG